MTYDAMRRPPVVTDEDRQWALAHEPADWAERAPLLEWSQHVAEQVERFEEHFGVDRKPAAEWSGLWRRAWWPKADPRILHPKLVASDPHPFVRRGDDGFERALAALTPAEGRIANRFGVVQFKPSDPRAALIGRDAQ